MAIVIKAGKDAEKMLRSRVALSEEEKTDLMNRVATGRKWGRMLEEHRKRYGL